MPEFEKKIPIQNPEFIWDKNIEPEKVQFNLMDNQGERIIGFKWPIKEFKKFAALVKRFEEKLDSELQKKSGKITSQQSGSEITTLDKSFSSAQ